MSRFKVQLPYVLFMKFNPPKFPNIIVDSTYRLKESDVIELFTFKPFQLDQITTIRRVEKVTPSYYKNGTELLYFKVQLSENDLME